MGAVGTMALSAIYLTGNANLMAQSYDKESQLNYAAEAGLAMGKAELNFNPAALPNTSYVALQKNRTLLAADNTPINGIKVNVWVGPTGSTTGQYGKFASVVAQAVDANGTGFVRRLELTQESFAKYAYWSNAESNNGSTIYFANGDALWGPVWSNDVISINNSSGRADERVSSTTWWRPPRRSAGRPKPRSRKGIRRTRRSSTCRRRPC